MQNSIIRKLSCVPAALCIAILVYMFFGLSMLDLPGIQYDEALFTNAALGNVDNTFIEWQPKIFGKKLPLMLMSYIGALKAFLYAPIFSIFGMTPVTLRLPMVFFGSITLLFTYLLVRRTLGPSAAVASSLLLAADPSFIYANKLDWGPVSLMLLLQILSLYFILRWLAEGSFRFLVLGGFFLGLGLYNKAIFIWYLVALFLSLLLFFRPQLKQRISRRTAIAFVCAFVFGCLPLIAYNISHHMKTFADRSGFARNWGDSLAYQRHLFNMTLDGSAIYNVVNISDPSDDATRRKMEFHGFAGAILNKLADARFIKNSLLPFYTIIAICLLFLLMLLRQLHHKRELCLFLFLLIIIVLFICLTPEATGPHHTVAIYPFPHILIGFAIVELARLASNFAKARFAALRRGFVTVVCILPILLTQVVTDARYLRSFQSDGGVRYWTDAIYRLAEFAGQNPDKTYLLMDWGLSNPLLLLSQARIKKEESWVSIGSGPDDEKIANMHPILMRSNSYLVFHAPPFEAFPIHTIFQRALDQYNLQGTLIKTFYQRNGQPVFWVYEIIPR
jgi:4-amino-4-deoxy-L-arabinose transferase-like glycosyltransferase